MASAQSDDEEMNYWPGFVDALSTMTMMLIFLMMILSLVIVNVSQYVSRGQITAIAKAAKLDTSGSSVSIENMTSQIISVLSQMGSEKKLTRPDAIQSQMGETQNRATEKGDRIASEGRDDAVVSNGKSTVSRLSVSVDRVEVPSDNPPKSSQTAPLDPLSGEQAFIVPNRQPSETRIQSEKQLDIAPAGGSIDVKTENSLLTLIFPPHALKPDDAMKLRVSDFLSKNRAVIEKGKIEIQALANTTSGQVTEARRLSYYRAMVARQMLLDGNIDPKLVHVRIVDAPSSEKLDYVYVIFQP